MLFFFLRKRDFWEHTKYGVDDCLYVGLVYIGSGLVIVGL